MARDGHDVHYLHSAFYEVKGAIERKPDDPSNFHIHPVSLGETHKRYQFGERALQEVRYFARLRTLAESIAPEWVISCNTPLIVASALANYCRLKRWGYIHWAQDLHFEAIRSVLEKKNALVGRVAGAVARQLEKNAIERASALVMISEDFFVEIQSQGIRPKKALVIPNWMPLDEMVPTPKSNPWSQRHGMDGTLNIMYVGTLSLKHEIEPFVRLAEHFANDPRVRIVVVAGGISFDALAHERDQKGLSNLVLFGWQKYEELSAVLGAGDILFATISPDASRFSVPCKVLTYASAGKPVLAHMPKWNLVSRIVAENQLGETVECGDFDGLLASADRLVQDGDYRADCARRSRQYAESSFNVSDKARAFYSLMSN
jgi:glycosyltransferase involved in cell wall biosynthesis